MKVLIEVKGYNKKQASQILKMIEGFCHDLPHQISVGSCRLKEIEDGKPKAQTKR